MDKHLMLIDPNFPDSMTRKRGFAAIIVMVLTVSTVYAQFAPVSSSPPSRMQKGGSLFYEVKAPDLPASTHTPETRPQGLSVEFEVKKPTITSTPITQAPVNVEYKYNVKASGKPSPRFSLSTAPAGMTINAASGLIQWLPSVAGGYQVSVSATNTKGTDTQEFTLTISELLFEPIITSIPPTQTVIDQTFKHTVIAVASPAATFSLARAPASMSLNSTTGDIIWTPSQLGVYAISVQASNSQGSVTQDFLLAVSMGSAAPTILSSPVLHALLGFGYTYDVEAAGNPMPLYSLTEHPPGMTIDAGTGVISWIPASPGDYYVTVGAENSEGRVEQRFIVRVGIPGSVPLIHLQSANLINPHTATLRATVNPSGLSTQVYFEYGINQVDEFQLLATPDVIEGFSDHTVDARLEGLVGGAEYKYRAVAQNQIGRVISAVQSFTAYTSSYQIAFDWPFTGSIDSLGYRLFSIPGAIDLDAAETLHGLQYQDWGIYADNGRPDNFFEAYDGSEAFRFKPGRGFWVLSRTNWMVTEQTVNTVQLDLNGVFQLRLQPGWNIIASPFIESIPWTLVREISPSAPPTAKLWAFNGSFYEVGSLEAYHAYYYFHSGENGETLSIPYPGLWPDASKRSTSISPEAPRAAPFLTLEATGFDSLRTSVEFLTDARASTAGDRLDQYAPRNGFSRLSLRIDPVFEAPYVFLALDARPAIDEGALYDIVLDAMAGERIVLQAIGLENMDDVQVFFVHGATGEFTDLHEQDHVVIYPGKKSTRHHLVVGPRAFVDKQRGELVPETFLLQQNYPNPFNRATTISYSLPEAGYVDLTVYDMLGRQVAQLAGGIQLAGFHEVAWEGVSPAGTHLSNGVYLLRMRTEKGAYRVISMTKVR